MIPPQALHYVGLALARAAGWGIGRLTSAALEGDLEIRRLSRLDEPSLLMEIALRESGAVAPGRPDDLLERGQATVERLLPRARARICPHRDVILKVLDSPEATVISTVAGFLSGSLPVALVKPMATLLVKRGLPLLCGDDPPRVP